VRIAAIPKYISAFVGREEELRALDVLVSPGRVVTLVGPGGVGKTRLALAFLERRSRDDPAARAVFCDLAGARDEAELCAGVARALDLRVDADAHAASIAEQVGRRLAREEGAPLVVLDNLEQVDSPLGATLGEWCARAPHARWVATSRRPLDVAGEDVVRVDPLPLPPAGERSASVLERSAAVRLFFARAAARPHGDLTLAEDGPAVASLVRRLEGMPLAIELAAARLDVLPLAAIADRLGERFRLLRDPVAREGGRHSTLWATIEWSWDLLTEWQRAALAQASVFEGSFDVEAAESVIVLPDGFESSRSPSGHPGDADAPGPLDALHALVRHSLVRADGRFALYVAVRDFATTRLDDASRDGVRARHARFFVARGSRAAAAYEARGALPELQSLERDHEDMTAALRRALDAPPTRESVWQAAALVLALGPVLYLRWSSDMHLSMIDAAQGVLARVGAPADFAGARLAVELAHARASVLRHLGRLDEAMRETEGAIPKAQRIGDPALEGMLLAIASHVHEMRGRHEASGAAVDRAIALLSAAGAERRLGLALLRRGLTDVEAGAFDACIEVAERAREIFRRLGSRLDEAMVLVALGMATYERGDFEAARPLFEQARDAFAALGERRNEAVARGYIGGIAHVEEHWDQAARAYEQVRGAFEELGDRRLEAVYRGYLGVVAMQRGRLDEAEEPMRASTHVLTEVGDPRYEAAISAALAGLLALRGDTGGAERALGDIERRLRASDAARFAPLLDVYRGVVEALRGDVAAATRRAVDLARLPMEDVRLALPLLRRVLRETEDRARTWTFAAQGASFSAPSGGAVELAARAPLARIVDALVRHRLEHPGDLLAKEPLVRAAWPDEARLPMGPGANRLKVAVSTLRRMGLEPLIVSKRGGYMLDPTVPVRVVDELTADAPH
jgi:predicted ATPase